MHLLKKIGKILFIIVITLVVIIAGWAIWERNRNPVATLDKDPGRIITKVDSTLTSRFLSEDRKYRHIILSTEHIGDIEAYISFPLIHTEEKIPVIIVLGGLEIGIFNFRYISEPGNNTIIIYQYAYKTDQWRNNSTISQIPIVRRKILEVPAQILSLVEWIKQQSWADTNRINLSGYSFGAFFVPAVYHLDNLKKRQLAPGVIAYGGVDIYQLLMMNIKKTFLPLKMLGSWIAATAIYPIEPALHLPKMRNEFLLINGTLDDQIPEESWKRLHQLTPEPKTIMILEEGHMHPRKPQLTLKLVNLSKKWLREHKVINP
jgi:dienelactone hydrolase